jgi:hypothetical protein
MGKDRSCGTQCFDDGDLKLVLQLFRNVKLEILHISPISWKSRLHHHPTQEMVIHMTQTNVKALMSQFFGFISSRLTRCQRRSPTVAASIGSMEIYRGISSQHGFATMSDQILQKIRNLKC